jgi:HEXXH motif-containing protein
LVNRPRHITLPDSAFAELASGGGSAEVVRSLWASEHSRRLVMLRAFLDAVDEDPRTTTGPLTPIGEAWQALERAEQRDPDAVAAVLMHPQVGSWLAYTLRRHRGGAPGSAPAYQDFGQLHALALAASAATGQSYTTTVPLRSGRVMVPLFGMARFDDCDEWATAEAGTEDGRIWLRRDGRTISVPAPGVDGEGWWALRQLTVGDDVRLTVWLDDLDPMRDLADPVPPARLGPVAFQRWADLLRDAWAVLVERHRPLAEALAAGVTSLVPLPVGDGWDTRSASTGDAFGAIMCSPPPDPVTLAVSLAHEFMHIKLGGLMHLFTMTHGSGQPRLYAPWRDDPRPAGGLLQGIYAFFGIAEFWRAQRSVTGGPLSDFEYAYAAGQTAEGLRTALDAGDLTEHGRRVAETLAGRLRDWSGDELDEDARRIARLVADGHRAGWRIRHCHPRPADVEALVTAWETGSGEQLDLGPSDVQPDPEMRHWSAARLGLGRRRLIAPDCYAQAREEDWGAALTDADLALFAGDPAKAATGFAEEIDRDPESTDAWTGLGLALQADAMAPARAATALLERPEVVLAVYRNVRSDRSPTEVASWVGMHLTQDR